MLILLDVKAKTLSNLLSRWRADGHDIGCDPWNWREIRPLLIAHSEKRSVFMPEDYGDLRISIETLRNLKSG